MNTNTSIGQYLRLQRENLDISLKAISQETKIHLSNLQKFENDDFDNLPNKAYLIGYIKSYSRCLNLNLETTLNIFENSYNSFYKIEELEQDKEETEDTNEETENKFNLNIPSEHWPKIGIALTMIIFISYFVLSPNNSTHSGSEENNETRITKTSIKAKNKELSSPLVEKQSSINTIKNIVATPETSKPLNIEKKKTVTPAKKSTSKEKLVTATKKFEDQIERKIIEISKSKISKEQAKIKVKKEIKQTQTKEKKNIEQKFYNIKFPMYVINKNISEDKLQEILPSNFKVNPIKGIQAVLINAAKGNSWITYKKDDDNIKKFVLNEGRSVLIRGKLIKAFIGNYTNVNVFLNNQLLKLSSPSSVKSLVFPQEAAKNLKLPLFIFKNGKVYPSVQSDNINQ